MGNIIREQLDNMHRINSLLSEGSSDILYHFTYTPRTVEILKNNKINLTATMGSKADFNVNRENLFFFSMTRSKSSGYSRGDTRLVIDARKLKNNHKIIPIDYWQYSKSRSDYTSTSDYVNALKNNEQEERLISNKAEIENASKYILEIHILKDRTNDEYVNRIAILANLYGIPIFVYENEKNWKNEKKPIPYFPNYDKFSIEDDNRINNDHLRLAALMSYRDNKIYNIITQYLSDNPDNIDEFNKIFEKEKNNYFRVGAVYDYEFKRVYENIIHNLRSDSNPTSRYIIKLLAKDMLKHKTTNLSDYLEKKQTYGKKTRNDHKKELYDGIKNIIDSSLNEYIHDYLGDKWIEIDGVYANKTYDSEALVELMYLHAKKLKEHIKNIIFSDEDIIKYSYLLTKSYIVNGFDTFIDVYDKLNITDISDTLDINDTVKRIFEYVLYDVERFTRSKIETIQEEIQKSMYED